MILYDQIKLNEILDPTLEVFPIGVTCKYLGLTCSGETWMTLGILWVPHQKALFSENPFVTSILDSCSNMDLGLQPPKNNSSLTYQPETHI